jgi:hypothetical protein
MEGDVLLGPVLYRSAFFPGKSIGEFLLDVNGKVAAI